MWTPMTRHAFNNTTATSQSQAGVTGLEGEIDRRVSKVGK